jgi:hypothetical protein
MQVRPRLVHKIKHFSSSVEVPTAEAFARFSDDACSVAGRGSTSVDRPAYGGPRNVAKEPAMATGETGFDDVTFDLISVQYHSLKAGHDYGQYVRDARNAGEEDIATFFEEVMAQDSERAHRCHEFLARLGGTDNTSPQTDV